MSDATAARDAATSEGRPLVCVTPRWTPAARIYCASESVGDVYMDAIVAAGGMPLMMPETSDDGLIQAYVDLCDGFTIPGGQGPDPGMWGEEPVGGSHLSPERDALEFPLLEKVVDADKPLLCVCRGEQVLNVAMGGSLAQDLTALPTPAGVAHWVHAEMLQAPAHEVVVEPGTLLASCVGGAPRVQANSNHHQAADRVGEGLVVSGRATDGVIEALELPGRRFCLGVQWHPEYTWRSVPTDFDIWRAFVSAAAEA